MLFSRKLCSLFASVCPGDEMGDTPDLGSGAARRVGSSPILGIPISNVLVVIDKTFDFFQQTLISIV